MHLAGCRVVDDQAVKGRSAESTLWMSPGIVQTDYMPDLTIALTGNQDSGLDEIYSALSGHYHGGSDLRMSDGSHDNSCRFHGNSTESTNLPGNYSLTPCSPDEVLTRIIPLKQAHLAVICVVNSSSLERALYPVVQLLEMEVPIVIALHVGDETRHPGKELDGKRLSSLLGGVPVVSTGAGCQIETCRLLETAIHEIGSCPVSGSNYCSCAKSCVFSEARKRSFQVDYGTELEAAIDALVSHVDEACLPKYEPSARWIAIRLLEDKEEALKVLADQGEPSSLIRSVGDHASSLTDMSDEEIKASIYNQRCVLISEIIRQAANPTSEKRKGFTELIDPIATNRWLGLPIFMIVMYFIFRLVIDVSAPFLDWVDWLVNVQITNDLATLLVQVNAPGWLQSMILDGVVAGVGGVLAFLPGLIVFFFFLALLEESGYLARAAFLMDHFMQNIGLRGRSVIPLMLGFGCAVPAIYATRTMSNRRDRLLTALLVPFMSCSARLPVYLVFAMAFFGSHADSVIWLMYALGIVLAVILGLLLSRTLLKESDDAVSMPEMVPYQMPTVRKLLAHTWDNSWEFVRKAGTLIVVMSIGLWLLLNLPLGTYDRQDSLYGRLSSTIAPALKPAGFGDWQSSGALVSGLIAKEMIVGSLSQIYTGDPDQAAMLEDQRDTAAASLTDQMKEIVVRFGEALGESIRRLISLIPGINLADRTGAIEDTALSQALQEHYSPLSGFSFLVFVLLYIPCVATIGTIRQEFGGRWAASVAIYQTIIAWVAAVLIFQAGTLLGLG